MTATEAAGSPTARRGAAAAAGDGLLRDRAASWLGCDDEEVAKLQLLLNSGTALVPGVLVVEDYFGHSRCDGDLCRPPSDAGAPFCVGGERHEGAAASRPVDLLGRGASQLLDALLGATSVCLTRRPFGAPRVAPQDEGLAMNMVAEPEVLYCPFGLSHAVQSGTFPVPLQALWYRSAGNFSGAADRDLPAPVTTAESVLAAMRQDLHDVDCSGCGQRIVGRRLDCTACASFSLCAACTATPMHWPGAALAAHRDKHPSHRFAEISLPALRCPRGHEVSPGLLGEPCATRPRCGSCGGPLHNGAQPPGEGPQFLCAEQACCFALCAGCYWASRRGLASGEVSAAGVPAGDKAQQRQGAVVPAMPDARALRKRRTQDAHEPRGELGHAHLRCHHLFSSPLCVGHTVRARVPCRLAESDATAVVTAWGVSFQPDFPHVVRAVLRGGALESWNERQAAAESLVREGDVLMQISVAGRKEDVRGRPPLEVLSGLRRALLGSAAPAADGKAALGEVGAADLLFSGLRSLPRLRVEDEIRCLQASGCELVARAATTENIRALIAADDCRVLHFSFHTSSDQSQKVFLEDMHGKAHVLNTQEFLSLLTGARGGQGQPPDICMVFISSCHSLTLGQLIAAQGVRHVICVQDQAAVSDASCQLFERHFFTAACAGRTVREAFSCGAAALLSSPHARFRADGDKFALLPEGTDHDEVLAIRGSAAAPLSYLAPQLAQGSPPRAAWGALPARAEDFVGREVDVYRLLVLLRDGFSDRRLVLLLGEPGIGKSALMVELGRYVQVRCELFQEVFWLSAPGPTQHDALAEFKSGLRRLGRRAAGASCWHVLLLVDSPELMSWTCMQRLLSLPAFHVVLAATPASAAVAAAAEWSAPAGVKPVRFGLGSLAPLAQAQLFSRRAARPLRVSEVAGAPAAHADSDAIWRARRPADYLALAASRLVWPHRGNPRRILLAAQALADDADAAPPDDHTEGQPQPHRKVCFSLPDGRERREWLPESALIGDIARDWSPRGALGGNDIFVDGCRARPHMALSCFGGAGEPGAPLRVELREKVPGDWDR